MYLGDGRFHLEAVMISNPTLKAYRYDPYENKITIEKYDHQQMLQGRKEAIEKAKDAKVFGLIFGILGRQGSPAVFKTIEDKIKSLNKEYVKILTPEIMPDKLKKMEGIDAFIQVRTFESSFFIDTIFILLKQISDCMSKIKHRLGNSI